MLVSNGASVLSFSRVAASILANASSVGAITVNSPPLRVSTRFTPGLSLPETAAVSVVSIGLFEAAVATGSLAMPATEPGPSGTCLAYAAQLLPTRPEAGSAAAVMGALEELLIALEEMLLALLDTELAVLLASSLEQADAPRMATAVRPTAATVLR